MSLKQVINNRKILQGGAVNSELELPGEPLIYSIKYSIGSRTRSVQFFRNEKWRSLLKCYFRSHLKTNVPLVVIVRFYVSPPSHIKVKATDLRKETIPAVHSFEICDYTLSFLELLHHVLINSYRQIVKIDADKFYSSRPRTVFKFLKWDHYVRLKNNNTLHPQSKSVSTDEQELLLQPDRKGNDENKGICQATTQE